MTERNRMSNLGPYQDITTAAKQAGGVDAWIKTIEDTAVAERAPAIFGKGAGAGLLVAGVLAGGVKLTQVVLVRQQERRALRDDARAQLKAVIEGQDPPEDGEQP